ncbi:hypothetical protein, partial [Paenibacillus sp. Y412MC10]|uniref:hypothetical protein n=1 Tax=Geobacillus sp. (strain Y412MC10) TaxID=481743 RepID=UPI001C930EC7
MIGIDGLVVMEVYILEGKRRVGVRSLKLLYVGWVMMKELGGRVRKEGEGEKEGVVVGGDLDVAVWGGL